MSKYVDVKGFPGMVRDLETNAILNVDHDHIRKVRLKKELRMKEKAEKELMQKQLASLESDISEIKDLLMSMTKSYK